DGDRRRRGADFVAGKPKTGKFSLVAPRLSVERRSSRRHLPSAAALHLESCERAALPRRGDRRRGAAVARRRHALAGAKAKTGVGPPRSAAVSDCGKL